MLRLPINPRTMESQGRRAKAGYQRRFHETLEKHPFYIQASAENPIATVEFPSCFYCLDKIRTILAQHGPLVVVAFSTDACLIDMAQRKVLFCFEGHDHTLTVGKFNHDGSMVAIGSADRSFTIWETATGNLVRRQRTQAPVGALDFSADGKMLLAGTYNIGEINVWEVETFYTEHPTLIMTLTGPTEAIGKAAFSADQKHIVASVHSRGYSTSKVRMCIWDLQTQKIVQEQEGEEQRTFLPSKDRTKLLCANEDRKVRIYDAETLQMELQMDFDFSGYPNPDSRQYEDAMPVIAWVGPTHAVVVIRCLLMVWDTVNNTYSSVPINHLAINVHACGDDKFIVVGDNNQITFWSLSLMQL